MNRFAPTLTDAQFAALPLSERFVLVAAYMNDVEHVQETALHDNHGPEIDAWCRILKQGDGGIPWCGIFVSICLRLAGYWAELPPDPASTHSWADWARANGHAVDGAPERGDIAVLLFSPTTGHMFAIVGAQGSDCRTIEGNTNTDGSRDGYEVARRERTVVASSRCVIVRLAEDRG